VQNYLPTWVIDKILIYVEPKKVEIHSETFCRFSFAVRLKCPWNFLYYKKKSIFSAQVPSKNVSPFSLAVLLAIAIMYTNKYI